MTTPASPSAAPARRTPHTRVSVLINNYNYQEFVQVAVDSVLAQTYPAIEIIAVDDGSKDDSLRVLREYGTRLTVVAKANGGQGSAYNAGFAVCSGDIVLFLDADDWLYPSAIAQIVAAWRDGVAKIQFPLTLVDREGQSLQRQVPRSMSDESALALLKNFGTYNSPPGSGNAYAAEFLRKVLPMNEAQWRIAADTVPISLSPAHGDIVSLPSALGAYRLHRSATDGSLLMNNAPTDLWLEYERIFQTKNFVRQALSARGLGRDVPLALAPWEARVAILCVRFGGAAPRKFGASNRHIAWFALRSLWRWPDWTFKQKSLQFAWMWMVLLLPHSLARRVAFKHKAAVGQSTA